MQPEPPCSRHKREREGWAASEKSIKPVSFTAPRTFCYISLVNFSNIGVNAPHRTSQPSLEQPRYRLGRPLGLSAGLVVAGRFEQATRAHDLVAQVLDG